MKIIAGKCIGYDLKSGTLCMRGAVEVILAGCVHEHLGTRPVCDWHAGDIRTGDMFCGDCAESAEPHNCKLGELRRRAEAG